MGWRRLENGLKGLMENILFICPLLIFVQVKKQTPSNKIKQNKKLHGLFTVGHAKVCSMLNHQFSHMPR
jgi:hypothetical protein